MAEAKPATDKDNNNNKIKLVDILHKVIFSKDNKNDNDGDGDDNENLIIDNCNNKPKTRKRKPTIK